MAPLHITYETESEDIKYQADILNNRTTAQA